MVEEATQPTVAKKKREREEGVKVPISPSRACPNDISSLR
jgi:hypothetical protein